MHKHQQSLILFSPSLLSGLLVVFFSIAVITVTIFTYLSGQGTFYDYLLGSRSSTVALEQSSGPASTLDNTVFNNIWLARVLNFALWALVGLLVYALIHYSIIGSEAAVDNIKKTRYKNARVGEMFTDFGIRLVIRLAAITGWIIYWIFFIKVLLPFCVLIIRNEVGHLSTVNDWYFGLLSAVVLILGFHLHTVFMRLIALRLRLFSDTIVEVER